MSFHYNVFENKHMEGISSTNDNIHTSRLVRLSGHGHDRQDLSRALEMAKSLQTTLEPGKLIELFARETLKIIAHDSLRYVNEDHGLDILLGNKQEHTSTYQLLVNDDSLGKIEFSRAVPFTDDELKAFEFLLSSLLYPLRNALLYQQALATALQDPLTGINNRTAFNNSFNREIEIARRHGTDLTLLVLDIDHFKQINDEYGHLAGDHVLQEIARRISNCIRGSDMLFRYGGEEFTILLSNTDTDGARLLAERIRHCICRQPVVLDEQQIDCSVSIGIATLQPDDIGLSLFERADKALYEAKQAGRDRVVIAR